jgi:ribosome-binding factor A
MSSRRTAKVREAIRESVSTAILFDIKDPRVKNVTVTNVEVSSDLRTAKIYVSVMGDDKAQALCMHGLQSARGFLQSRIADRIQTRFTPVLRFVLDQGVKKSIATSRLLREVLADSNARGEESADSSGGDSLSSDTSSADDGEE